ncbi:MAG: PD40 domain-containing protein, partial [Planctomycetes bacterium]|nr:PD40 domain-containing protein [Planctomycetota bacterium]
MIFRFAVILVLFLPAVSQAESSRGYYRHPALHQNTLIFTAEGDLWRVGIGGGVATRLTSHLAQETHAAVSADGKTVAFSADYEGTTEVYTMPIGGGRPRRITFDGEAARVVCWTPTAQIAYATRHFSALPNTQLVVVDPKTRKRGVVPLSQASDGSWDARTGTLYFTRFRKQGSSTKRYKGGWVERIWKFVPGSREAKPLTNDFAGTSRNPMWHNGRVYFVTDRDGTLNLWSMNASGKERKQHTFHKGFDVLWPSLSGGKIVYQWGADLHVYDLSTRTDRLVPITLSSDFDQTRERWIKKPISYLSSMHLSPQGDRLALTARGRVFVVPVSHGRRVEVTRKSGVRYRAARFLPDGKSLLALSDETGEMEFWRLSAAGVATRKRLTRNGGVFRFGAVVSPNGKLFAYRDKNQKLWLAETATGKQWSIAISQYGEWSDHGNFSGLAWSADSRWLAWVDAAANSVDRIFVHNVKTRKTQPVTSDRFDSFSPAWGRNGKSLYFLSDRNLVSRVRSPWGQLQPEPYFTNKTRIYHLALRKGGRSPFAPRNEFAKTSKSSGSGLGSILSALTGKSTGGIDFDGIETRIRRVPVPSGNYRLLDANATQLFWIALEDS